MYQTNMYEGMLAETVPLKGYNGDVINAYVSPVLCRYLTRLAERLNTEGLGGPLYTMSSSVYMTGSGSVAASMILPVNFSFGSAMKWPQWTSLYEPPG